MPLRVSVVVFDLAYLFRCFSDDGQVHVAVPRGICHDENDDDHSVSNNDVFLNTLLSMVSLRQVPTIWQPFYLDVVAKDGTKLAKLVPCGAWDTDSRPPFLAF